MAEVNARPFAGIWSGTGTISGNGDEETINLEETDYEEGEVVNIGANAIEIIIDLYGTGSGPEPIVKYKDGDSYANCIADAWNVYSGGFVSTGYVQIRVEY